MFKLLFLQLRNTRSQAVSRTDSRAGRAKHHNSNQHQQQYSRTPAIVIPTLSQLCLKLTLPFRHSLEEDRQSHPYIFCLFFNFSYFVSILYIIKCDYKESLKSVWVKNKEIVWFWTFWAILMMHQADILYMKYHREQNFEMRETIV